MVGSSTSVLTAGGFHVHDGCLYAFYGCYDYAPDIIEKSDAEEFVGPAHFNTRSGYIYTKDGVTWSKPISLGLPLVANHGPQKTPSGRLIISGNVVFPYTDNPNGVEDYQITGIYADAFEGKSLFDDSEAIQFVTPARGWNANLICEGSFFQTDDGILHMMLRSNTPVLWCSESRDDGVTWSDPVPTGYSDDSSKFHFGRLPDGRYYGISNTVPGQDRCPLMLCLSEDGVNFNRHYIVRDEPCAQHYAGRFKHGHYGYPHSLVHEGYLYVIYSKKKESVEVTKIDLKSL
jgi:hypothetical protein